MSNAVEPVILDVMKNSDPLENLIKGHDLVISLLPYTLHSMIAKVCIRNKTNMLTASYLTPQLMELNEA